jgi:1-acyl-sn-glycerol-3-phosphate acyltransferase
LKIRGTLTVAAVGVALVLCDLIQRTFVVGLAWLMPARRDRILAAWQQAMARLMLGLAAVVGGARFGAVPVLPARSGVLVLMNHQSLLDIPLVIRTLDGTYPRIVTRARYARGKPVISHMVRLYQYPTVDPRATVRGHIDALGQAAAESHVPVVIFPEGTRTRDGEIGPFKRAGLRSVLGGRPWEVWVVVSDGTWRSAKLKDFLGNVGTIRARMHRVGPFRWDDPTVDPDPFIGKLHEGMREALAELRVKAGVV